MEILVDFFILVGSIGFWFFVVAFSIATILGLAFFVLLILPRHKTVKIRRKIGRMMYKFE